MPALAMAPSLPSETTTHGIEESRGFSNNIFQLIQIVDLLACNLGDFVLIRLDQIRSVETRETFKQRLSGRVQQGLDTVSVRKFDQLRIKISRQTFGRLPEIVMRSIWSRYFSR